MTNPSPTSLISKKGWPRHGFDRFQQYGCAYRHTRACARNTKRPCLRCSPFAIFFDQPSRALAENVDIRPLFRVPVIGTEDNIGNSWRGVYRRGTGRGFPSFLAGRSNNHIDGSENHVDTSNSSSNSESIFERFDQLNEAAPSARKTTEIVSKTRHRGKNKSSCSTSSGSSTTEGDKTRPSATITTESSDGRVSINELNVGKGRGDNGSRCSPRRKPQIAAFEGSASCTTQADDCGGGSRGGRGDGSVAGGEDSNEDHAGSENDGSR